MVGIQFNKVFAKIRLIFYTCPTCKWQVQITSRKSLVNIENAFWKGYFCGKKVSSSSEEELDELFRRRIVRQPRNFAERRPLGTEKPRQFREKLCLPVDAFAHLLELIGLQMEHRTRRNGALTARQQLLIFLYFLGTNSFYHVMHSCHEVSTSTFNNVANHSSCCPCNINPKARFHSMVWTPCHGCCSEIQRHSRLSLACVRGRMCWRNPRSCQPTKSRRRRIR